MVELETGQVIGAKCLLLLFRTGPLMKMGGIYLYLPILMKIFGGAQYQKIDRNPDCFPIHTVQINTGRDVNVPYQSEHFM